MNATPIRITNAGDLIAAVPALLGFTPTESIIAIGINDGSSKLGVVIRTDVSDVTTAHLAQITQILTNDGAGAVVILVVADEHYAAAITVAGQLRDHAAEAGIDTLQLIHTRRIGALFAWLDLITGNNGIQNDPHGSAVAAAQVIEGHRIDNDRAAVIARFAPTVPVAETTDADTAAAKADPHAYAATVIVEVAAAVRDRTPGTPQLAARFAPLIEDMNLFTAAATVAKNDPGTGADLFTQLASHTRRTLRAHLLTLAAWLYYAAGNGPSAGIALDAITDTHSPAPRMVELLETALQNGMRPEKIRELLDTGAETLYALGIDPDQL